MKIWILFVCVWTALGMEQPEVKLMAKYIATYDGLKAYLAGTRTQGNQRPISIPPSVFQEAFHCADRELDALHFIQRKNPAQYQRATHALVTYTDAERICALKQAHYNTPSHQVMIPDLMFDDKQSRVAVLHRRSAHRELELVAESLRYMAEEKRVITPELQARFARALQDSSREMELTEYKLMLKEKELLLARIFIGILREKADNDIQQSDEQLELAKLAEQSGKYVRNIGVILVCLGTTITFLWGVGNVAWTSINGANTDG